MIKAWNQLANQFTYQCLTGLLYQSCRFSSIYSSKYIMPTEESKIANQEYSERKYKIIKEVTKELVDEHLKADEERYQNKICEIMEIYYSMDEDERPIELKPQEIDYLVKMKRKEIKNYIRHIRRKHDRFSKAREKKQAIREAVLSRGNPELGRIWDQEGKPIYKMHNISLVASSDLKNRIRFWEQSRIALASVLGTLNVIIDFDYDQHMTVKQHMTVVQQIKLIYGVQRKLTNPLCIYFCNYKSSSPTAKLYDLDCGDPSKFLIKTTEESYLDLFPKEKLVYLTADTDQVLKFDPEDVYIIGGMIDTKTNEPVSAIKSAREGIRAAKLPLCEYFTIRNEVKSLKMNQVFRILADLHEHGDMQKAIEKNIAKRIRTQEEIDHCLAKTMKEEEKTKQKLQERYKLTEEELELMILLSKYHKE